MAAPTPTPAPAPTPAQPGKKPKRRTALWIALACIALGAAGGGWWAWQARASARPAQKPAAARKASAQYFALQPAFVVNLADTDAVRYLQAEVQLMTRDPATLAALEQHAPALRHRLLLLLGQQSAARLADRRGKELLQQQALAEVRAVLRAEAPEARVEALYFTSLVTQ